MTFSFHGSCLLFMLFLYLICYTFRGFELLNFLSFNLFVYNNTGYLQGHKHPLEASRVLEEYAKVRLNHPPTKGL